MAKWVLGRCTLRSFVAASRGESKLNGLRKLRNTLVRTASKESGASYLKIRIFPSFSFVTFPYPPPFLSLHLDVLLGAREASHITLAKHVFSLPHKERAKRSSPLCVLDAAGEESVVILGGYRQYLCFQVAVPVVCVCACAVEVHACCFLAGKRNIGVGERGGRGAGFERGGVSVILVPSTTRLSLF